jgi:carbonic anhydrase
VTEDDRDRGWGEGPQSIRKLVDGIHEFHDSVFGPQRDLFERLIQGQTPDALFITCSDSRINPNLVTQTAPGDLFILRNAGNLVPPYGPQPSAEAATIEFAVLELGVTDIIVCGHTHCGAMAALLEPQRLDDMPAVRSWLGHAEATRRVLRDSYAHLRGRELLEAAVLENVLVQIEHLRTHPSVLSRLMRGRLNLHAWIYKLEDGTVHGFDPVAGQFVQVEAAGRGPTVPVDRLNGRSAI